MRVGMRHDQCGSGPALWADGTEDAGPNVAGVAQGARAAATCSPDAGQRALLADPRFILEPYFEGFAPGVVRKGGSYRRGEVS